MKDARLVEQSNQTAPIYVCANALPSDRMPLDAAIRLAGEAGADGFELRRELLPAELTIDEIQRIRAALAELPAPPFYSTPQPVFLRGRFPREAVAHALEEARAFGCKLVKFAPGETLRPDDVVFDAFCATVGAAPGALVSMENDQTQVSADLDAWAQLFERAEQQRHCALGMTFDLGNWDCLDMDAVQAARALGRYVVYVHAKAVRREGDAWVSVPFRKAATQHPALAYLPRYAPRAIEFRVPADGDAELCEQLRGYVNWLRAGTFDTRASFP